ncbi:hypothetical protein [Acetobacter sp.]|jgi:hypothetical protein|uniref:hypothetical protein n=1 Tax=Acetobacter sp. TaxID=440 RepID=UPI0025B932FE|nr:hypothetical protein [Acetobacter sp.]MCH4090804.1 hypothetical protein [Acetobacter sp.]MCI1300480.1 hypothetical protein [Acetobacter sp.]MCI1316318.1 hypothetical protein [Acetobacter sp.]
MKPVTSCRYLFLAAACGLLLSVVSPTVVLAATREEQTAACKGDALKLCAFSIPNEKKIAACLQAKRDRLSPACKAMFPEKKSGKRPAGKKN